MTGRAILLGLALGLFVSAFTFFNDAVIGGSWFISNHLPVAIFGPVVLLLLVLNPLLRSLGRRGPLNMAEVAVIAALGLAACGWPSFSFYWGFIPNTATPQHWMQNKTAWQARHVMSYVPGASSQLGHGHVRNWTVIAPAVLADRPVQDRSIAAQVGRALGAQERQMLAASLAEGWPEHHVPDAFLSALNRLIREGSLEPPAQTNAAEPPRLCREALELIEKRQSRPLDSYEQAWLNRHLLTAGFPQAILPPPPGRGVLLTGSARARAATDVVVQGLHGESDSTLAQIDWGAWWPTLRLWVGLGLALSIASLCLALIVHPQWSRRELLIYPLAQFVVELGRREENHRLPTIAFTRLFWVGILIAVGIHLFNGLAAWFPAWEPFRIPLHLELGSLQELFPTASRVQHSNELFRPYLYLSVIGFAFFLTTSVSFSIGIASFAYVAFAAMLLTRGVSVEQGYLAAGQSNLLRVGAFLSMAVIIGYIGRRYYGQLALSVAGVGCAASKEVPTYVVWAGRVLLVCAVLALVLLRSAGLDWLLASLFVLLVLLMFLVLTRIVAETGLFFVQPSWMPVAVLTALFGIDAIGPTSYILLALASIMIVGDPRTTLMPYIANALQMVERSRTVPSLRLGCLLLAMILAGCVVAGVATFAIMHEHGILVIDDWSAQTLPARPFDELSRHLSDMRSGLTLAEATANDGLGSLKKVHLSGETLCWLSAGAVLLGLCAFARLRLPCWPLHPVLFLIWGTMPASRLAVSFLLGWAIKFAVMNVSGARGYRAVLPLMVGLIAGELLAALGWTAVGAGYYFATGMTPVSYRVYP